MTHTIQYYGMMDLIKFLWVCVCAFLTSMHVCVCVYVCVFLCECMCRFPHCNRIIKEEHHLIVLDIIQLGLFHSIEVVSPLLHLCQCQGLVVYMTVFCPTCDHSSIETIKNSHYGDSACGEKW